MNNTTTINHDAKTLLMTGIYINNYYLWMIFAFGFPGNFASVVTILRMQKVTTSTFYVATLAVFDNFAIVLKLTYHQMTLNEVWLGSFGCKTLNFLVLIFPTCANWILVFIATERFVAVKSPLKIGMFWTIPRAVISVVILVIVVFCLYCHILWTYTGFGVKCDIHLDFVYFYRDAWYWIDFTLYSIGPCVLLTTLNIFIILSVRKSTVIRKQLSMKKNQNRLTSKSSRTTRQDRQITVMLVSVSVVFVILTVPRSVFVVVHLYWQVVVGTLEDAQKYLLDQIAFFLCDASHAVNFYLYFITGKKFRHHFLDMICHKKQRFSTSVSQSGATLTLHTKYKAAQPDDEQVEDKV